MSAQALRSSIRLKDRSSSPVYRLVNKCFLKFRRAKAKKKNTLIVIDINWWNIIPLALHSSLEITFILKALSLLYQSTEALGILFVPVRSVKEREREREKRKWRHDSCYSCTWSHSHGACEAWKQYLNVVHVFCFYFYCPSPKSKSCLLGEVGKANIWRPWFKSFGDHSSIKRSESFDHHSAISTFEEFCHRQIGVQRSSKELESLKSLSLKVHWVASKKFELRSPQESPKCLKEVRVTSKNSTPSQRGLSCVKVKEARVKYTHVVREVRSLKSRTRLLLSPETENTPVTVEKSRRWEEEKSQSQSIASKST